MKKNKGKETRKQRLVMKAKGKERTETKIKRKGQRDNEKES